MTKVEAVKELLKNNKGVASLEFIYNNIETYYPEAKKAKDWQAGIRGIINREIAVQKHFKRLGTSLYALLDYEEERIEEVQKDKQRMHSYMQGICLEIGNFLNLQTYTSDKSAKFNNVSLSELATMPTIPNFTYPKIIEDVKQIDVLWFNEKGYQYPKRAIEVVDSLGTLEAALKRTLQLIEFNLSFSILCKKEDLPKVEKRFNSEPYIRTKARYQILPYEHVVNIYNNAIAYKNDPFLSVQNYF